MIKDAKLMFADIVKLHCLLNCYRPTYFLLALAQHNPVSYTHLDVYKRQVSNNFYFQNLQKHNFPVAPIEILNVNSNLTQLKAPKTLLTTIMQSYIIYLSANFT